MLTLRERSLCPICEESKGKEVVRIPFTDPKMSNFIKSYFSAKVYDDLKDEQFIISYCQKCDFFWQKRILTDESLVIFYDSLISAEDSLNKRIQANKRYYINLFNDAKSVLQFFPHRKPSEINVLDYGMGWGHWLQACKSLGMNTFGHELSDERRKYAIQNGLKLLEDKKTTTKFDFINTDQVVEHLADLDNFFKFAVENVNSAGVIKIFVPNGMDSKNKLLDGKWIPTKSSTQPLEHINSFTRSSLTKLCSKYGFERVSLYEFLKGNLNSWSLERAIKSQFAPSWYFRRKD